MNTLIPHPAHGMRSSSLRWHLKQELRGGEWNSLGSAHAHTHTRTGSAQMCGGKTNIGEDPIRRTFAGTGVVECKPLSSPELNFGGLWAGSEHLLVNVAHDAPA